MVISRSYAEQPYVLQPRISPPQGERSRYRSVFPWKRLPRPRTEKEKMALLSPSSDGLPAPRMFSMKRGPLATRGAPEEWEVQAASPRTALLSSPRQSLGPILWRRGQMLG